MRYIPELDGLRFFAIFGVLLVHSNFAFQTPALERARSCGWIGVDLFFAISGYLITSILLASKEKPNYYRNFYARRGLRIWPLYYLLLLLVFAVFPHVGGYVKQDFIPSVHRWQYYVFYFQNLILASLGSFSLVITWSLCVEEQFYLIWPFFVRLFSKRMLEWILIGVLLLETPFRMFLHHIGSSMGFFYTFARLDPLAAGALVALRPKWFKYGWLALPWAAYLLATREFEFVFLALGVGFASIVSHVISRENRVLASSPLRYMGKISYGVYIWHATVYSLYWATPIYRLVQHLPFSNNIHLIFQILLPIPVAALSWKYVEQPILKLKKYFENTKTVPAPEIPLNALAAEAGD